MAEQVTLEDVLSAHEGINDTIRKFYPHLQQQEEVDQEGNDARTVTSDSSQVESEVDSFLDAVSGLEDAREQLTHTLEQANAATLNEASATLTHPQILGQRVAWCVEAEQHMKIIVENKDLLIYHLQQPLIATFLTMHHKHHRSLVSLVGTLSDLLNCLHCYTDLLERHAKHSALDTADSLISSLSRAVATQRSVLNDITTLQTLVAAVLQDAGH